MPEMQQRLSLRLFVDGLAWTAVGLFLLFVTELMINSLNWVMVGDAALMHYVGKALAAGAVPYKELFDINFPAAQYFHALFALLFGNDHFAWRLTDLALLALATVAVAVLIWPVDKLAALFTAAVMAYWHVDNGPYGVGQRDYLLIVLLLIALVAFVLALEREGRLRWLGLFGSGALLCLASLVKPTSLVLLVPFALFVVEKGHGARWPVRSMVVAGLAGLAGFVLVALAFAVPLALNGAFSELWTMLTQYGLPIYPQLERKGMEYQLFGIQRDFFALGFWPLFLALLGLALYGGNSRYDYRIALALLVMTGFGLLSYFLQGRGWFYHLYPFVFSFLGLTGYTLALARRAGVVPHLLASVLLVSTAVLLWASHGQNQATRYDDCWRDPGKLPDIVTFMTADLDALAPSSVPVQVMDTNFGAIHALAASNRTLPTRFPYDYQFFVRHPNAYLLGLRKEFLADLERHPHSALVITNSQWPETNLGYDRLQRWPELQHYLAEHYQQVNARQCSYWSYRVYAPKAWHKPGE